MLHPQHLEGSPGPPEAIGTSNENRGSSWGFPFRVFAMRLGDLEDQRHWKGVEFVDFFQGLGFLHPRFGFIADRLNWEIFKVTKIVMCQQK